MAFGARRFGLTDNPVEIDNRIQRIELELKKRQLANLDSTSQARRRDITSRKTLNQVTGLRIDNNIVGSIGVSWNALINPDLLYYEVQFSTEEGFIPNTISTFRVPGGETSYIFTDDNDATITRFVRVRGISKTGEPGPFSSSLNTTLGLATTNQVEVGVATNVIVDKIEGTNSFDKPIYNPDSLAPSTILNGVIDNIEKYGTPQNNTSVFSASLDAGSATITTSGGVVLPTMIASLDIENWPTDPGATLRTIAELNRLTATVYRNDTIIDVGRWDLNFITGDPTTGAVTAPLTMVVSGFATFDLPPPGIQTYKINWLYEKQFHNVPDPPGPELDYRTIITFLSQQITLTEYRK